MSGQRVFKLAPPPSTKAASKSSRQRLMHDFKEVQENPLPFISAHPVQDNLFYWHCNLVGPEGTPYSGAVYHLVLTFPLDYPQAPPSVCLCVPLPHPNVFGSNLCLDMLQSESGDAFKGWSSGYTVQSILVQLQSFLFVKWDTDPSDVLKSIAATKEFKCPACEHRPHRPWPALALVQGSASASWNQPKTTDELLQENLMCFFTKVSYTQKTLGIGVSVKRNTRTQQIQSIKSNFDLLSIYSFNNLKVRKSASNMMFTYWMPVFINREHGAKAYALAKKAVAMIYHDRTTGFEPFMVLDVLPKMMCTLIVDFCVDSTFASLKELEGFCAIHRMLLRFVEEYPELRDLATLKVSKFISEEKYRDKEVVTALGEFLCLLSVSTIGWDELKTAYSEESFCRGVFWIINDYPELNRTEPDPEIDAERPMKSFAAGMVGHRLLCFTLFFIENFAPSTALEKTAQEYDERYGFLSEEKIQLIQRKGKEIAKTIRSFQDLFEFVRLPPKSHDELCTVLRNSISSSLRRGYHGARKTGTTVPEFNAEKQKKIEETIEKSENYSDHDWRDAFINVFDSVEPLKERPSWAVAFQEKALEYYLSQILHQKGDFAHFKAFLKSLKALTSVTFTHKFPGSSKIKDKTQILKEVFLCLPNLDTLHLISNGTGADQKALIKNFCIGLNSRDCLKSLTLSLSMNVRSTKQLFSSLDSQKGLLSFTLNNTCLSNDVQLAHPKIETLSITLYSFKEGLPAKLLKLPSLKNLTLKGHILSQDAIQFLSCLPTNTLRHLDLLNFSVMILQDEQTWCQTFTNFFNTCTLLSCTIAPASCFPDIHTHHHLLKPMEDFYKALGKIPELDLHSTDIVFRGDSGKPGLIRHVLESPNLRSFKCSSFFYWESKHHVAVSSSLESLEIRGNSTSILRSLTNHPLKKLIMTKGDPEMRFFLNSTRHLEELTFSRYFRAHNYDIAEMFTAFSQNQPPLSKINISCHPITLKGATAMAKFFKTSESASHLTSLNLYNCELGPRGAIIICESLFGHPNLTELDIGLNGIKDKASTALAKVLATAPKLQILKSKSNFFSEEGLFNVTNALTHAKSIKDLRLNGNPGVSFSSVRKILFSVSRNPEDMEIDFAHISITDSPTLRILDRLYLDIASKFIQLDESHLERTIVVTKIPRPTTEKAISGLFLNRGCGAVTKVIVPHSIQKNANSKYAFVQFDSPESVTRALDLGASKKAILACTHLGVYKAGTSQNKRKRSDKPNKKKAKRAKVMKHMGWSETEF